MAIIGRVLLMPKGDYSGTAVYNSLDWVRYDSKAWVCKVDNTVGVLPDVSAPEWQLLAQDGSVSGSVAWSAVTGKPLDGIATNGGIIVDGSNNIKIDPSYLIADNVGYDNTSSGLSATTTQDAIDEIASGGGGGDTVAWNQIQTSTGATKIATITINSTPTDVYAPSGGGASSLDDLSDVGIDAQTLDDGQILAYNLTDGEFQNVDMPTGGHNMLDNSTIIAGINSSISEGTSNDDVVSAYGVGTWSNLDGIKILTQVSEGDDVVGSWNDTWETDGDRTGWIFHKCLYYCLRDDDIDVAPIFVVPEGTHDAVGYVAERIDDEYYKALTTVGTENPHDLGWYESDGQTPPTYTLTNDTTVQAGKTYYERGGAVAIKLNAPIPAELDGIYVGVYMKINRTKTFYV